MAVFTGAHMQFPHRNSTYDILSEKKLPEIIIYMSKKVCSCTQSSEKLQVYSRLKTTNISSPAAPWWHLITSISNNATTNFRRNEINEQIYTENTLNTSLWYKILAVYKNYLTNACKINR